MRVCRISISSKAELFSELSKVGASPSSLPFFENKREMLCLLVNLMPSAAANILKQEMLSVGGDAAVHAHAVDCREPSSRAILFGCRRQLAEVTAKLKKMPWWGFPELADEILSAVCERSAKTQLMGIINLTDDSFFASSRTDEKDVVNRAKQLVAEGADIIDIGAESSRPNAERVAEDIELAKITQAVRAVRTELPNIVISTDTTRVSVAAAALENGADIINDVSGLADERMAEICAEFDARYVLMHSRGNSKTMDSMCDYGHLLFDIADFFEQRLETAEKYGLNREKIILDPGYGFAKNREQNLYLLKNISAFRGFGLPLLAAVSRKRFLGEDNAPEERLEATLAATVFCVSHAVEYVRVHDVAVNKRAANFAEALKNA